jgi:hypothetical protein
MTPERMEEVSMSAEDEMFEALIAASGVPVRDDE